MTPERRRTLSKQLSTLFTMPALQALGQDFAETRGTQRAYRIGFSGPPGAGKSSLIAAWAKLALRKGREVGVLAVDPTSPVSGGSLLGDRIRMDDVTENAAFFLRSVPSRSVHDGLCPNVAALLDAIGSSGVDDVVLETVGVGQTDYAARLLVDTFVIVLNPQSGDVVQAMKAGILEVADVIVVNKSDLPAAERMVREISGVISLRRTSGWRTPVVAVSVLQGSGLDALDASILAHAAAALETNASVERHRGRQRYRLRSALVAQIDEVIATHDPDHWDLPFEDLVRATILRLRQ